MKCALVFTVLLFADVLLVSPIASLFGKYLNPLEVLGIEPKFNAETDVFYILYTRSNRNGVRIGRDADEIRATTYNVAHATRFLFHGFVDNQAAQINVLCIEAYLRRGNFNVIVVDWGAGAQTMNYFAARNRVNQVGLTVGSFIDFMNLNGLMNFNTLNLVGHSLGAHAAGITGKRITRGVAEAVFALDPAGPLFSLNTPDTRVAPNDAEYVEVIHANGGGLGFLEPIGQADFFPNWGSSQPGCGDDVGGGCAHNRVVNLFAESINNLFNAQRCGSFNDIQNRQCTGNGSGRIGGDNGRSGNSGIFFLETNKASPFSRG